jgi:hypothetical protein
MYVQALNMMHTLHPYTLLLESYLLQFSIYKEKQFLSYFSKLHRLYTFNVVKGLNIYSGV